MQANPNQLDLFGYPDPAIVATAPIGRSAPPAASAVKQTSPSSRAMSMGFRPASATPVVEAVGAPGTQILAGAILPNALSATPVEAVSVTELDPTVMTFGEHRALMSRVIHGDAPVEPTLVRASFERLVRDVDTVKSELGKFKIAELLKHVAGLVREKRKDYLVRSLIADIVTDYGVLACGGAAFTYFGFQFEDMVKAARNKLDVLTPEVLLAARASVEAASAERQKRRDATIKALINPETLDEFKVLVEKRGLAAMTADQRVRYDELVAEQMRSEAIESKAGSSTIKGVDLNVAMEIVETKHTRDQHDLWVVRLVEKVGESKFAELSSAAKRLGGYYSSYRAHGAVTGFQFKIRESAQQFMAIARGESVDNSQAVEAREEKRNTAAVGRLRATALRTRESAEAKLNQPRLTNTAKRASQASHAESDARKAIALADTMSNIADAIENGQARHLDKLTEKSQVELLRALLIRAKSDELHKEQLCSSDRDARRHEPATLATVEFVQFPHYFVYEAVELETFIEKIQVKEGFFRLAAKLKPYVQQCRRAGENSKFVLPGELVHPCIEKLGAENSLLPRFWCDLHLDQKRLARMGITTPEQLRASCREFVQFQAAKPQADRATELERKLVGTIVGIDFFPTPRAECQKLVEKVNLQPGETALDPQAGTGNIAQAIRAVGVEPDVIEISSSLREVLEAKGFNLVGWDFLEFNEKKFDAIVMNPPFSNDIAHVQHAFSLLTDKGRLSSIVGESSFTGRDAKAAAFRAWLEEVNAEVEKLPEGTFNDRSLLRTTSANARRVTIHRGSV